ncbi:DMT family transporter [Marinobacterium rhizophilum]|uniref:DMT family transporter n=2 Tax=Marinobacterium rhizophilum TaxID=420402 RepID=A0ABY5HPI7_9GAMM|nr:DMT family transporter [Marinobacterium rhizophilum]
MLVFCLVLGMQQITIKATADDISPVLQIALRSGISALLVGLFMQLRGTRLTFSDGSWKAGLLAGALFATEYLLMGESLRHTSASHVVIFMYTAPLFAALGLHFTVASERLAPLQWLGILLAFGGIAIAFLGSATQTDQPDVLSMLWGDTLALLAGAAWGMTTVILRTTRLSRLPATHTLMYQLVVAFVVLMIFAIWQGQTTFNPTPEVWASLAFQSVVVSFASLLLWFWLLQHYLASRLGAFSFLTPLFGAAFGAWLLNEPIEPRFLLGALFVLTGIVLVSGYTTVQQALAYLKHRAGPKTT